MAKATSDIKSDSKTKSNSPDVPVIVSGSILPSALSRSADIAERGVDTSFAILQGARAEIRSVTDATVDYAEGVVKSTLGLSRTVAARVDELAGATLDQARGAALDLVGVVRNTGRRASAFAADTSGELFGDRATA